MQQRTKLFLLVCLLSIAAPLLSQSAGNAALDTVIDHAVRYGCFNGEVLVVDDSVHYDRVAGSRDNVAQDPLVPGALFNIASVSKPFTAVAVLQLQENGLLNVKDAVVNYLPTFPYPDIRIEHLLSHTSGITANMDFLDEHDIQARMTNDSILPMLSKYKLPLNGTAGGQWSYSNLGYDVLAVLVERVSGQPFATYVQDHILRPAGMTRSFVATSNTVIENLPSQVNAQDMVVPHAFADIAACEVTSVAPWLSVASNDHFFVGSSNLYSSVQDLVLFDKALRENVILNAASQALAYAPVFLTNGDTARDSQTPIPSYQGLGWSISNIPGSPLTIWFKGRSAGTRNIFLRQPEQHRVVVLYDNYDHPATDLKGIACLRVREHAPYRDPVRNSLVQVLGCSIARESVAEAIAEFKRINASDGAHYYRSDDELIELVDLLLAQKSYPQAQAVLDLGKELFPTSFMVLIRYGDLHLLLQQADVAVPYFRQAVPLYSEQVEQREELLNILGYNYLMAQRLGDGELLLRLNCDLFPASCNALDSYASALDMNNKLDLAIRTQRKAVAMATEQRSDLLPTLQTDLEKLEQKAQTKGRK